MTHAVQLKFFPTAGKPRVPLSDAETGCRETLLGVEYNGTMNTTRLGVPCQDWASDDPHGHYFTVHPGLARHSGVESGGGPRIRGLGQQGRRQASSGVRGGARPPQGSGEEPDLARGQGRSQASSGGQGRSQASSGGQGRSQASSGEGGSRGGARPSQGAGEEPGSSGGSRGGARPPQGGRGGVREDFVPGGQGDWARRLMDQPHTFSSVEVPDISCTSCEMPLTALFTVKVALV